MLRSRGYHLSGPMTRSNRTVIFWGAGATADLGIPTTDLQASFILRLADTDSGSRSSPLSKRIRKALQRAAEKPWISAFEDLLTILGDDVAPGNTDITTHSTAQMDAMRRNMKLGVSDKDVRNRIVKLRTLYDWRALRSVVSACPGAREDGGKRFKLVDLFNILDMHEHGGHGFRVECNEFLTSQRISGARNALEDAVVGDVLRQLAVPPKIQPKVVGSALRLCGRARTAHAA